jgi:hypothetical protein
MANDKPQPTPQPIQRPVPQPKTTFSGNDSNTKGGPPGGVRIIEIKTKS